MISLSINLSRDFKIIFYTLVIVNNAAVKVSVQIVLSDPNYISFKYVPKHELLGYIIGSIFALRDLFTISIRTAPLYTLTSHL